MDAKVGAKRRRPYGVRWDEGASASTQSASFEIIQRELLNEAIGITSF